MTEPRIHRRAGRARPACRARRCREAPHGLRRPAPRSGRARRSAWPSARRAIAARRSTARFNDAHVLAISAGDLPLPRASRASTARCSSASTRTRCRCRRCDSALEVLAANGVETMIARGRRVHADARDLARDPRLQPRPHATGSPTASSSRRRTIRPTTAASSTTRPTAGRPTPTSRAGSRRRPTTCCESGLQRRPAHAVRARRCAPPTTHRHDFLGSYVADLGNVIDFDAIRAAGIRMGVDPLGGAGVHYWARIAERYGIDLTVVSDEVDPTIPLHDARLGRPHPHGPVVAVCDAAADRAQGPLRHRVRLRHRPRPPRHRHAGGRPAAAEPLSGGRDRLPVPQSAAVDARRGGRQDGRQQRA